VGIEHFAETLLPLRLPRTVKGKDQRANIGEFIIPRILWIRWSAHTVGYIVYVLCRIIGLEGSMGTAMTRRRSGPWPDSADQAMSVLLIWGGWEVVTLGRYVLREWCHAFIYPVKLFLNSCSVDKNVDPYKLNHQQASSRTT
jgi:hypothetical protein